MDWASVGEVVKVLSPVATACAAWFAAIIAYGGLNKWRSETLGKRKAEIAEATLASVYEMEEILRLARAPFVLPHEMAKKEGFPDERSPPRCAPGVFWSISLTEICIRSSIRT